MTGFGRRAAETYNDIIRKMLDGELGDGPKMFFTENPEGIIDITRQSMKCTVCGNLESLERMSMLGYIDDKAKRNCRRAVSRFKKELPDIEGFTTEYIRSASPKYFVEKKAFEHKCIKCGGKMEPLNDFRNAACPICGGKLAKYTEGFWD